MSLKPLLLPSARWLPRRMLAPDPTYHSPRRGQGYQGAAAGDGNGQKGGAVTLTVVSALFGLMLGSPEPVSSRLELTPAAHAAFAASPTARLGCLLGSRDGATVRVDSVLATDDSAATAGHAVARAPCPPQALGRLTRAGGPEAQSFTLVDRTVRAVLAGAAVPFATAEDRTIRTLFAGRAVDWEDALAIVRRQGRQLNRGSIERWTRAIRSALRPRIAQSLRLTLTYRRPMGARLGIIVDF
jgi:hypothetical protein